MEGLEDLFVRHTGQAFKRAGSSGLLLQRSTSVLSTQDSIDQCSDSCSECAGPGPSYYGRIAQAKRVLAEATHHYQPCAVARSATKIDKCRNTGALGPLMAMLQSEARHCPESLVRCLDTLAFLLLDRANRAQVSELDGLPVLLGLFVTHNEPGVLRLALDCVATLVKNDDRAKEAVWHHPARCSILSLLSPRSPPGLLLSALAALRKVAFRGPASSPELVDPAVLHAIAALLATPQPPPVVTRACRLLRAAAADAGARAELSAWERLMPALIPLLSSPSGVEPCLGVLSALSSADFFALKNILAAAGGLPPLLPLLLHASRPVRVCTACILTSLSEGGLSRELLCCAPSLAVLLHILAQHHAGGGLCADVAVSIVYVLTSLARYSPAAAAQLMALGAPQCVAQLMPSWADEELRAGGCQLVRMLHESSSAVATAPHPSVSAPKNGSVMAGLLAGLPTLAPGPVHPFQMGALHTVSTGSSQHEDVLSLGGRQLHPWHHAATTGGVGQVSQDGSPTSSALGPAPVLSSLSSISLTSIVDHSAPLAGPVATHGDATLSRRELPAHTSVPQLHVIIHGVAHHANGRLEQRPSGSRDGSEQDAVEGMGSAFGSVPLLLALLDSDATLGSRRSSIESNAAGIQRGGGAPLGRSRGVLPGRLRPPHAAGPLSGRTAFSSPANVLVAPHGLRKRPSAHVLPPLLGTARKGSKQYASSPCLSMLGSLPDAYTSAAPHGGAVEIEGY